MSSVFLYAQQVKAFIGSVGTLRSWRMLRQRT